MNYFFVCLMVALLCSAVVFAQKKITNQDPLIDQTDFKHDKQYFLDHYGKDDSTKALINTFFRARKAAVVEMAVGLVLGGSSAIYIGNAFSQNSHYSLGASLLAFPLIPFAAILIIEAVDGSVIRLVFTKKKLLHLVADYQQGKHLPRRFTHQARYRRELRMVKGIKPTIWNILLST